MLEAINEQLRLRKFGLIGIVIGIMALTIGAMQTNTITSQSPRSEAIAETASKLKDAIINKNYDIEIPALPPRIERSTGPDEPIEFIVIVIGLLAAVVGIVGFAKKEKRLPVTTAVALGGAAIGFQFAVIGGIITLILLFVFLTVFGLPCF
jgi:hypothetical protein